MKRVDTVAFQKRKETIEGDDESRQNYEIDIFSEGPLNKELTVRKDADSKQPCKTMYELINDEYI